MRLAVITLLLLIPISALAITGNAPMALLNGRHAVMIVGSHGTLCTGAAIARDLVLTAGHCIETSTHYKVVEFDAAHQPQLLDVRQVSRHPQFNLQTLFAHRATADIALMKMAQLLPAEIIPAALGTDIVPQVGETLSVFGYGVAIRGDGKSGGRLRAAPLTVTGRPSRLQVRLVDPKTGGSSPGLGACTGDSGAPVFADTVLIGVVSWSTGPNLSAGCGGMTGVTPVALYRAWIVDEARRLGSPLPP
ncbi:MAG TPA: S1 family peptidase [Pseudolabrys sp.]|nr:S1 family peptidase [Pseudolabrys sp.]